MKQTVFSALAVCAASSLVFANESEDWLTLDKEIESLASSLTQGGSGVAVSAFVKSTYNSSSDAVIPAVNGDPTAAPKGNDWGAFALNNVRINFDGSAGDFGAHIGLELGPHFGGFTSIGGTTRVKAAAGNAAFTTANTNGVGVTGPVLGGGTLFGIPVPGFDAYATFSITEQVSAQAGVFRAPFHGGSLRDEDELLFVDRTFTGDFWANVVGRDTGVQFSGSFDQLGFWFAIMNGRDYQGDKLAFAARVAFNAMGNGTGSVEGAYGAEDGGNLTVAAGYYEDDDSNTSPSAVPTVGSVESKAYTFEVDYTAGAVYLGASMTGMSDGFGVYTDAFIDPVGTNPRVNNAMLPWDVTFSYMVVEDTWEVAARYEDLDDLDDTSILSFVANKYVEGHDVKWQIQYSKADSDIAITDVDVISLGLLVSV